MRFRTKLAVLVTMLLSIVYGIAGTLLIYLAFQKSLDMGPDKAIGVKGVNDVKKSYFQHTYLLPGEYQVVFIAKNVNASGLKEKIVKLNITVTE